MNPELEKVKVILQQLPQDDEQRRVKIDELCGTDDALKQMVLSELVRLESDPDAHRENQSLVSTHIYGPDTEPSIVEAKNASSDDGSSKANSNDAAGVTLAETVIYETSSPRVPHDAPVHNVVTQIVGHRLLGTGGQGEVWLAHETGFDRLVALKVLKGNQVGREVADRFQREAVVTARLEHPNIVPVYAFGSSTSESGTESPFYTMRVFSNPALLELMELLDATPENESQQSLAEALRSFSKEPTNENLQQLKAVSAGTQFESKDNDARIKSAINALGQSHDRWAGQSLQQVIRSHFDDGQDVREQRELLKRFRDVCNAVAYAHSRGVIHRDLKPANIMLGEFGETLVVDWGLAKLIHGEQAVGRQSQYGSSPANHPAANNSDAAGESSSSPPYVIEAPLGETMSGTIMGTPAYMPLEQAMGEVERISPCSDVYCLGGILYAILTGQPPISNVRSYDSLIDTLKQGKIEKPSVRVPEVAKALDAVCMKALSPRPEDRYQTATELGDEIARWLDDEPVSAWREPLSIRARRWMRKHQTIVTSTAAAVAMAVVGLSILSAVVGHKNQLLTEANQAESAARQQAEDSEKVARAQADLALATMRSVVQDIQTELENNPAARPLRRKLLTTALNRLKEIAKDYTDSTRVDTSVIVAVGELGDLLLEVGIGSSDHRLAPGADIGNTPLDREQKKSTVAVVNDLFERGYQVAKQLHNDKKDDIRLSRLLAGSTENLAKVKVLLGQLPAAMELLEEVVKLREKTHSDNPNDKRFARSLSSSLDMLATGYLQSGKLETGREFAQRSLKLREQLASAKDSEPEDRLGLSYAYEVNAKLAGQVQDSEKALEYATKSLKLREEDAKSAPEDADNQHNLSTAYELVGTLHFRAGRIAEGLQFYQQAADVAEELSKSDPNNLKHAREWAISVAQIADVYVQLKRLPEAKANYTIYQNIVRPLAESDPFDKRAQRDLSVSYVKLANVEFELGNNAKALELYKKSYELDQKNMSRHATDAEVAHDFLVVTNKIGQTLLELKRPAEARQFLDEALAAAEKAVKQFPDRANIRRVFSITLNISGNAFKELGDPVAGYQQLQRSHEIILEAAKQAPADGMAQRDTMVSHYQLGEFCKSALLIEQADKNYQAALKVIDMMIANGQFVQEMRGLRQVVEKEATKMQAMLGAFAPIDEILKLSSDNRRGLLSIRGLSYASQGITEKAIEAAEHLQSTAGVTKEDLYNVACIFGVCANGVSSSSGTDESSQEESDRKKSLVGKSIQALRRAIAAGWNDFSAMDSDPDLRSVRLSSEYKTLRSTK